MAEPPVGDLNQPRITSQPVNPIDPGHTDGINATSNPSIDTFEHQRVDPQVARADRVPQGRLTGNVLSALPLSAHCMARRMLSDIRDAEDRDHATKAIHAFAEASAAKYPKAVAKIVDDTGTLLAFFDFPAEHWIHLKTTNPISV
jgi:hypothetical protein